MKLIKAALCCLLLWCLQSSAWAGEELSISLPATVRGFTPCKICIVSPAAGEAELQLFDRLDNPWLTLRQSVSAGENVLPWDGLGANDERLMAGPYHFEKPEQMPPPLYVPPDSRLIPDTLPPSATVMVPPSRMVVSTALPPEVT